MRMRWKMESGVTARTMPRRFSPKDKVVVLGVSHRLLRMMECQQRAVLLVEGGLLVVVVDLHNNSSNNNISKVRLRHALVPVPCPTPIHELLVIAIQANRLVSCNLTGLPPLDPLPPTYPTKTASIRLYNHCNTHNYYLIKPWCPWNRHCRPSCNAVWAIGPMKNEKMPPWKSKRSSNHYKKPTIWE